MPCNRLLSWLLSWRRKSWKQWPLSALNTLKRSSLPLVRKDKKLHLHVLIFSPNAQSYPQLPHVKNTLKKEKKKKKSEQTESEWRRQICTNMLALTRKYLCLTRKYLCLTRKYICIDWKISLHWLEFFLQWLENIFEGELVEAGQMLASLQMEKRFSQCSFANCANGLPDTLGLAFIVIVGCLQSGRCVKNAKNS